MDLASANVAMARVAYPVSAQVIKYLVTRIWRARPYKHYLAIDCLAPVETTSVSLVFQSIITFKLFTNGIFKIGITIYW